MKKLFVLTLLAATLASSTALACGNNTRRAAPTRTAPTTTAGNGNTTAPAGTPGWQPAGIRR